MTDDSYFCDGCNFHICRCAPKAVPLRCGMVTVPSWEGSPDVFCGKPARRRIGDSVDGACDGCIDEMAQGGDFALDELEEMYPMADAPKRGGKGRAAISKKGGGT